MRHALHVAAQAAAFGQAAHPGQLFHGAGHQGAGLGLHGLHEILPGRARGRHGAGLLQYPGRGVGVAQGIAHAAQRQGQVGGGVVLEVDEADHAIGTADHVARKGLAQAVAAAMHLLQRLQALQP